MISQTISHYTFRAWAIVVDSEPNNLVDFSLEFADQCFKRCMCSLAIDSFTNRIHAAYDRDLEDYITDTNFKLDAAACDIDNTRLFSILKPIYRRSQSGAAAVIDKNGHLTLSLVDTKRAISEHFASLLCGVHTSMAGLIRDDRNKNVSSNQD
jgi:hypothetical protein